MDAKSLLLQLLIIMAAIVFNIASGRAKGERLRQLSQDLKDRRPRGYAIIGVVALVTVASPLDPSR